MRIVLWLSLCLLRALSVSAGSVAKAATRDPRWERQWVAPRDGEIKLHIALRQDDNGARAEQKLLSIADPNSPNFRQHLDSTKASYLATPGQGTVHAVEWWLAQHGLLRDAKLVGGIFEIDTTIRQAEKLLNTTYFFHSDGTNDVVRTERFYLPDSVNGHIDFVAPTTSFPRPARERIERPMHAENGASSTVYHEGMKRVWANAYQVTLINRSGWSMPSSTLAQTAVNIAIRHQHA